MENRSKMKTLILDDDETVLYEQDDPGYIHAPIIFDGRFDVACYQDDCPDPRCAERRAEAERLLDQWIQTGQELAFIYHFRLDDDLQRFEKLPNSKIPIKVRLESYSRNQMAFNTGERVGFFLPALNVYSSNQVTFSTEEWEASLFPWSEKILQALEARSAKLDHAALAEVAVQ
jgi:hypothetical protein